MNKLAFYQGYLDKQAGAFTGLHFKDLSAPVSALADEDPAAAAKLVRALAEAKIKESPTTVGDVGLIGAGGGLIGGLEGSAFAKPGWKAGIKGGLKGAGIGAGVGALVGILGKLRDKQVREAANAVVKGDPGLPKQVVKNVWPKTSLDYAIRQAILQKAGIGSPPSFD